MKRLLPIVAMLAGCADQALPEDGLGNAIEGAAPGAPAPVQPAGPSEQPAVDPKSAQGAGQVLRRYFALVEAGDHAAAAKLWRDGARARAFAAELERYGEFETNIAAPRLNGAAGSVYAEMSLQLLRRTPSGLDNLADGTAVLRRANDVPGSTVEQRQWRIERIGLQPPPVPLPMPASHRFVGRWASEVDSCRTLAWRFTATSLATPAGSRCTFSDVREVPGGYDIAARCTAEGPPVDDLLKLRFAQSARALLFESRSIADAGLVRCG